MRRDLHLLQRRSGATTFSMKVSSTPGICVFRRALGEAVPIHSVYEKDNVKRKRRGNYEQMVVESRFHRELQLRALMSLQSDNDSHGWNLRGY